MRFLIGAFWVLFFTACATVEDDSRSAPLEPFDNSNLPQWLIPKNQVISATGKDGIPSIDEPKFIPLQQTAFLNDNDRVLLLNEDGEIRVYPYRILDWHEVVNDRLAAKNITITFCPLTSSAIAINADLRVNDSTIRAEFGVSGLIYNSNLIYYDRQTGSYWSQMLNKSVHGPLRGYEPETYFLLETVFSTARELFPDASVLSRETGHYSPGQYFLSTYEDYRIDEVLYFPLNPDDTRLQRKERVLSFFGASKKKAYRFREFRDTVAVFNDTLGDLPVVVAGQRSTKIMVGFQRRHPVSGLELIMKPVQNALPVIMEDQFGNRYDLFGIIVNGIWTGQRLEHAGAVTAYWLSWASMFPALEIYSPQ